MKRLLAAIAFALAFPAAAQEAEEPVTPNSVVASASANEWVAIAPEDLLVMELAPADGGSERMVVIQLIPPPFSQPWVENIRTLARAHWWDGTSVYRVVDNWVTQWGDVSEEKALPEEVVSPDADYESTKNAILEASLSRMDPQELAELARLLEELGSSVEYQSALSIEVNRGANIGSEQGSFFEGWPISQEGRSIVDAVAWPIHCYGHVGVARSVEDTGTGSELYAVIGHAPRQLDRNIAVVGRVIEGIEHLSTLPRGTGDAGVYESREEDTPILSVRLASELPDAPAYEYLDTASETFARYVAVRANRNDPFYTVPAGGVDVCNVQVPVRLVDHQQP